MARPHIERLRMALLSPDAGRLVEAKGTTMEVARYGELDLTSPDHSPLGAAKPLPGRPSLALRPHTGRGALAVSEGNPCSRGLRRVGHQPAARLVVGGMANDVPLPDGFVAALRPPALIRVRPPLVHFQWSLRRRQRALRDLQACGPPPLLRNRSRADRADPAVGEVGFRWQKPPQFGTDAARGNVGSAAERLERSLQVRRSGAPVTERSPHRD